MENNNFKMLANELINDEISGKYVVSAGPGVAIVNEDGETNREIVFGTLIRALRERDGISVKTLADKIGVSSDEVLFVELESSSKFPATKTVVDKLANYFRFTQRECVEIITGIDKTHMCPVLDENIDEFLKNIPSISKQKKAIEEFQMHLNRCQNGCPHKEEI